VITKWTTKDLICFMFEAWNQCVGSSEVDNITNKRRNISSRSIFSGKSLFHEKGIFFQTPGWTAIPSKFCKMLIYICIYHRGLGSVAMCHIVHLLWLSTYYTCFTYFNDTCTVDQKNLHTKVINYSIIFDKINFQIFWNNFL
jgi:hypothetical protein